VLKTLKCNTLGDLDNGQAGTIIDAALTKAINDLEDRGEEDGKPRTVTISVSLQKSKGLTVIDVTASAKMPDFRSNATIAEARYKDQKHEMLFQDLNAENPNQPVFKEMDTQGGEVPNE
jgi:hypothetical protein